MAIFLLEPWLRHWQALRDRQVAITDAAPSEALSGERGPVEAARGFAFSTLPLDAAGRGAALMTVQAYADRLNIGTLCRTWRVFDEWTRELRGTVAA